MPTATSVPRVADDEAPFILSWPPFHRYAHGGPKRLTVSRPTHIYVHFPFCRFRCPFCLFKVETPPKRNRITSYLTALWSQIEVASEFIDFSAARELRSIYFGGGTPSLLSAPDVSRTIQAVSELGLSDPREITLEVEPGTASQADLSSFVEAGVTRFSIGVQTFSDSLLKTTRHHSADTAERTIRAALDSGVKEVNVDLMAGLRGQSTEDLVDSVHRAVQANPTEVTVYRLASPRNTIWAREGYRPSHTLVQAMYSEADSLLLDRGFLPKTTFTYSRGGEQSYPTGWWSGDELIGLGNSAYGFVGGTAYQVEPRIDDFIRSDDGTSMKILRFSELSPIDQARRELVLGLQLQRLPMTVTSRLGRIGDWLGAELPSDFIRNGSEGSELSPKGRAEMPFWLASRIDELVAQEAR